MMYILLNHVYRIKYNINQMQLLLEKQGENELTST